MALDSSIPEEPPRRIGHLGDIAVGHLAYAVCAQSIERAEPMSGRRDSEFWDRGRPSWKAWPSESARHMSDGLLAPHRQASFQPFGAGSYRITTPPRERVFRRQRPVQWPTVAVSHHPRVRLSGGGAGGVAAATNPSVQDSRGLLPLSITYTPTQSFRLSGWPIFLTCGILSSEPGAGVSRASQSNPTW